GGNGGSNPLGGTLIRCPFRGIFASSGVFQEGDPLEPPVFGLRPHLRTVSSGATSKKPHSSRGVRRCVICVLSCGDRRLSAQQKAEAVRGGRDGPVGWVRAEREIGPGAQSGPHRLPAWRAAHSRR